MKGCRTSVSKEVASRVFTLTGGISIQDGVDKSYFLPKVRAAYPHAARHLGNDAALSNLANNRQREAVLVGHGKPGILFTANGDELGGPGEFIDWRSDLRILTGLRFLWLVGCRVGAGAEGALLLNTIARAIRATVVAPTGEVYFGRPAGAGEVGLYLEAGTSWQRAIPDQPEAAAAL